MIEFSAALPFVLAFIVTVLLSLLIYLIYIIVKKSKEASSYDRQLQAIIDDTHEVDEGKTFIGISYRWNHYWQKIAKASGAARYTEDNATKAGREALILGAVVAVLFTLFSGNILAGIIVGAVSIWVMSIILVNLSNRTTEQISRQLPMFLSSLKANIEARDTNERALLKVIDKMPPILQKELEVVRERILSSGSFVEALSDLAAKTSSQDLRFLCECMIQSAKSGSQISDQIDSIQSKLKQQRAITYKVNRAAKSVQPTILVSSLVIPGIFLFTYLSNPMSQEYWFIDPLSWVFFGVTFALYGAGIYFTKKDVDKIKNMQK